MIRFLSMKFAIVLVLAVALLSSGCVKRIVTSHVFGIFGRNDVRTAQAQKVQAAARADSARKTAVPDDSLRGIFAQQTRSAFNPATDDRRIQMLNARLRMDPQDAGARLELAEAYERYRLYDDALDHYTRVLNLAGAPTDRNAEAAAAGIGRAARAAGRAAEALPLLAAFLKKAPVAAEVWNELGLLEDDAGNAVEAEQALRQATALEPNSGRMHNNLGYHLLEHNQLAAAEAELRRALEINRASAAARNNLGLVLARRGDYPGALKEFLAAGDAAAAHNNLAVALIEMGEYEQGREELVQALQARNYFPPAIENFKLVQELLRERADRATAGGAFPLNALHPSPALERALQAAVKIQIVPRTESAPIYQEREKR